MRIFGFWGLLAVAICIAGLSLGRQAFVSAPSVDPAHPFDTARAKARLERILGDERPHPVDSDANDLVRERLLTEIQNMGFSPEVRDETVCSQGWGRVTCARVQNVVFWVTKPGPEAVMMAAHYDSVPAGPGASDDGAGVATVLEIANVLKQKENRKPVLALITDGEEFGLLGAKAFVDHDPLAEHVVAVVNVEARGVSGPVSMFETSRPNSHDLEVLSGTSKQPTTNLMTADIYDLMPNDTDMSRFLELDIDAANYAFIQGVQFYHTPGDNLAHFSDRSLFHMGANALAAVEAFEGISSGEAEVQYAFSDLLGQAILLFPLAWAYPLLGVAFLLSLVAAIRVNQRAPIRSILLPVLTVLVGTLLAVGVSLVVGMVRTEEEFAAANPWAIRGLQTAAALLGAGLVWRFFAPEEAPDRAVMATWSWVALLCLALMQLVPGAAILFVPPLSVAAMAAVLGLLGLTTLMRALSVLASVLFAVLFLPMAALGETALFVQNAGPFMLFFLLAFLTLAPLVTTIRRAGTGLALVALLGVAGFGAASLVVPAYSVDVPGKLNIFHVRDHVTDEQLWAIGADSPLPADMAKMADFQKRDVTALRGEFNVAVAPDHQSSDLAVGIVKDETSGASREITLKLDSPDLDMVQLIFSTGDAEVSMLDVNGQAVDLEKKVSPYVSCVGRQCRQIEVKFAVPSDATDLSILIRSAQYGLGEESHALHDARPDFFLPVQWGDVQIVTQKLILSEGAET